MISQDLPPNLEVWEFLAVNVYRETFRFFIPITSAAARKYRHPLKPSLLPALPRAIQFPHPHTFSHYHDE
jgi:hypothetical protein